MADRECKIADCAKRHFGRGFCQMHYQRWRKHGDPLFEFSYIRQVCSIDDCGTELGRSSGLGMCSLHYGRWKRHGSSVERPRQRNVGVVACSVDGCLEVTKAKGVCSRHLSRLYRHGSAVPRLRGEVVDGKRICAKCKVDVPLDEWVIVADRFIACRDCYLAYMRTHNSRRRALMRGAGAEDFTWLEIFERDKWTCGICAESISQSARWPDPLSPSLDHVMPLSRGGSHTRANTQASHLVCNMRKQARIEEVAA